MNGARVLLRIGHYGFEDAVGLAFDQIRRSAFASGEVAVLERLLEVLRRATSANHPPERRRALWSRAFTVARLAPGQISDPEDAVNLVCRAVGTGEQLLGSELREAVRCDLDELAALSEDLRGGDRVQEAVRTALGTHTRD